MTWKIKFIIQLWVLVSLTDKISYSYIRDLRFNPAYTKNWLESWSDIKELLSGIDVISWNSLKKFILQLGSIGQCQAVNPKQNPWIVIGMACTDYIPIFFFAALLHTYHAVFSSFSVIIKIVFWNHCFYNWVLLRVLCHG